MMIVQAVQDKRQQKTRENINSSGFFATYFSNWLVCTWI